MKNIETDSKIPNDLAKPLKIGDIVEGKIIGAGRSAIYLDLAPYGTGVIYGKEFYEGKDTLKKLGIGDILSAKVVELDNEEGFIELSVSKAEEELAWRELAQKKENDETIKVKILGANKGGLLAQVSGIQAFLPVSQLSSEHYPYVEGGDQAEILKELKKFVGTELEVKILDISRKERKLILSEKAKEIKKMKELLKDYKVGDIVEGEITAVLGFGAFIKFPLSAKARKTKEDTASSELNSADENKTLEGLIHISELDWQLIEDPSDIVKVGERVNAQITKISNGRVSLSLKALKKDPWQDFSKEHKAGEIIPGKVSKFNDFGAFVQVDDKIQGLCHISEFGSQEKMKESLEIGKTYNFEIISLEPKEHRLTLKLKSD
jgi:small subunit ribosomal protein S1